MKNLGKLLVTFVLTLCTAVSFASVNLTNPPEQVITEVTDEVLTQIRNHPELQKEDPSAINNLVDKHILPYSDFPRMARMAVGPQWRNATPEQKEEIQTLFRKLLIAVYSGALKEASDYSMQLGRNNINPNEKVVLVRTKLTASQREPIQLDYRLLKTKDNEWKVFDVNVGGVWLVENYRSQFASVISNGGINGLITELRKKANK